ncbi:hypothetical protein EMIT0P44_100009 [Pseudomonas sp. IT-P44]
MPAKGPVNSLRPENLHQLVRRRRALLLLQLALVVHVENRRRGLQLQVFHQLHVRRQFRLNRRRYFFQRLERTGLASPFVVLQGFLRILGSQQCRGFARTVFTNDADHDVPQLHLAGLHPRARLFPEHVAVRAVRIAEQVHHARRILVAVTDPVARFHLAPDFLGHRRVHQFLQRRAAQVFAVGVVQIAQQHMFAIRRQVQRHATVLVLRGITAQAIGRIELADDFRALGFDLLDCFGQLFGSLYRRQVQQGGAQGQRQQVAEAGHGSFLEEVDGVAGFGVSKFSRARARLASDSSPR